MSRCVKEISVLSKIVSRREGRSGRITLNSDGTQHRLDLAMCVDMIDVLLRWRYDETIEHVCLEHFEGSRGFCAGTDFKALAKSRAVVPNRAEVFLRALYLLCGLIARYPKPIVTLMHGVAKSSGIGLGLNGTHRVATENTVLSYPDTACGFTPDAGATLFLSRLPKELGTWLALTGERLSGADALGCGLATHFCASYDLKFLKQALSEDGLSALEAYRVRQATCLSDRFDEIGDLFSGDCVKELVRRLDNSGGWAKTQATRIRAKSPLSTCVAFRQIRTGRYLGSIDDALKLEFRLTSRLVADQNFEEGVRAALIDMDYCPQWKPYSLKNVTCDLVSKFFRPLGEKELRLDELELLNFLKSDNV